TTHTFKRIETYAQASTPSPAGRARGLIGPIRLSCALEDLVDGVPAIARIRAYFARPAASLPRFGPFRADKHLRSIDFIHGAVTRALMSNAPRTACDAQCEGFALHARGGMHARNLEQIRHVLGVVDLVEQIFLLRIDVHAGNEDVFRLDGHARLSPFPIEVNY